VFEQAEFALAAFPLSMDVRCAGSEFLGRSTAGRADPWTRHAAAEPINLNHDPCTESNPFGLLLEYVAAALTILAVVVAALSWPDSAASR
jgi:hypothetical protein